VSFFWLNYHYRDGQFAGAVVIEATALIIARMQAAVFGLDFGVDFAGGHEIDDASAQQIPESMIGRWLDHADLRRLRLLLTKKPQAPSVKASPGRTPQRTDVGPRRRPKPVPARRRRG
jgi:preprotein translocase subunit SecF